MKTALLLVPLLSAACFEEDLNLSEDQSALCSLPDGVITSRTTHQGQIIEWRNSFWTHCSVPHSDYMGRNHNRHTIRYWAATGVVREVCWSFGACTSCENEQLGVEPSPDLGAEYNVECTVHNPLP
jgi:hypothetical protein